jgi:hypothetical protein
MVLAGLIRAITIEGSIRTNSVISKVPKFSNRKWVRLKLMGT